MKIVNVFKINNIDYSIIKTNKNNNFVIPNSCFTINENNITIDDFIFKTTDSHNYELYLKIKESEEELKIIEILKNNDEIKILNLEKEIGKEKLVNSYVEEYFKDKTKTALPINYNNYIIGIRKYKDVYNLDIKKINGEIISAMVHNNDPNNPYKLLTDFNKHYTIYFDMTMLKYKVNMINYIKSIFENNYSYPIPKYSNEEYTKLTNNEIINIFKNEGAEDLHMNLGTEYFINKLVEIINSEISFNYKFGEIEVKIMLYKNNLYIIIKVYNDKGCYRFYYNTGTNAYELLNDVLNKYYFDNGCFKRKSSYNYMMTYLESIVK